MRTLTRATVLALGLYGTAAFAQSGKVAFVDGQRIFASVPGRTDAEATFNKEMETVRAQEKLMGDSLQTLIADYGKAEATLSAADKTSKQQTIRDKQAAFQQRQQQLEQRAQQRQNELVQPILDRIHKAIDDLRTENGYALVLDYSPNAGGAVVSFDKNMDITDQVVRRVQSMPVASGGAPGATPATPSTRGGATSTPSGVTRPKTPPGN